MKRAILLAAMMLVGCAGRMAEMRFTPEGFEVRGNLSDAQLRTLVDSLNARLARERVFQDTLEYKRTDANVTFVKSQAEFAKDNPSSFNDGRTRITTGLSGVAGYGVGAPQRGVIMNSSEHTLYAVIYDESGRMEMARTQIMPPDTDSQEIFLAEGNYEIEFIFPSGKVYMRKHSFEVNGRRRDNPRGWDWYRKVN